MDCYNTEDITEAQKAALTEHFAETLAECLRPLNADWMKTELLHAIIDECVKNLPNRAGYEAHIVANAIQDGAQLPDLVSRENATYLLGKLIEHCNIDWD